MSDARRPAAIPARVVRGRHGAVASPHHLATGAGLAALRAGGSAVDAAIATNAALAVVSGYLCGLGGDAFWLVWDPATATAHALNGSGRSGSSATAQSVRADGHVEMPESGRWTVNVPGAVDSWGRAHARWGRLAWADLLAPAIELAEGFPASVDWLAAIEAGADRFGDDGDWARVYRPDGRATAPGEIVRLPQLAASLRRLADDGADTAYRGALAEAIAAYFAAVGVPVTADDLSEHRSEWAEPIAIGYRDATALTHPPNSVGVVALQALGLLASATPPDPEAFDGEGWHDPDWLHLGLEAARLGLEERDGAITDPVAMPHGTTEAMLAPDHIASLAARIDPRQATRPGPRSLRSGGGTVYLAATDRWGGAVSLLQSNFLGFGSGLVDPATGIAFHDRGAFFSLDPAVPNALAPRKRTAHTLCPGLLLRDGRPWVVHGSMGGEIQPQVFTQFVSAMVDGRTDVATAVAAPRWAAMMRTTRGPADRTLLEARVPPQVAAALAARGHEVEWAERWDSRLGHAHAIELVRDEAGEVQSFAAAADPRSEGAAAVC